MSERIVDYDPSKGMAFQGDVSIIPVPKDILVDRSEEIAPRDHRLILAEGEVTGHHHAIDLLDRRQVPRSFEAVDRLMADASAGVIPLPSARLFRDPKVVLEMQKRGIISRTDLTIAILIIDTGPMCLSHEEHDGIRIPPGSYLVGRQIESAGAEERRVQD